MPSEAALQAFLDAWNSGDPDAIVARYAPGGTRTQFAHEETTYSGDSLREHIGAILHAVPNAALDSRAMIEQGDTVVMEWTFSGEMVNDFGPIPGTGQRLVLKGSSTVQFDENGLITNENVYWDNATMMAAAGMLG
jgi:steroid delta-isomerase-like uncharacterized protein